MISIEALYCLTICHFNNASNQFKLRTAGAGDSMSTLCQDKFRDNLRSDFH